MVPEPLSGITDMTNGTPLLDALAQALGADALLHSEADLAG